MKKIAILIPCYNEEKTIHKVVSDFKSVVKNSDIYVYDNNSTDSTVAESKKAGAIVRFVRQQGKGNVIRRMFEEIEADCYVLVDGDDTYPAECVLKMIELVLEKNVDMVVGDRLSSTYFTENKRRFHNFGNALVKFCVNSIFKVDIKDILTGFRAFSYRFVKTYPVVYTNFEIETEMTIHAIFANMLVENVEVKYRDRPSGSVSKLNTVTDGCKVLKAVTSLFKSYKPFKFFSILTLAILILDLLIFIPAIWIPYCRTGLVEKIPTLIVCGFMGLSALLCFFNGIILDSIKQKEKREISFRLIQVSQRRKNLKLEE